MRYVIKEAFWSWGKDFRVYNECQEEIFKIEGPVSRGATS